MMQLLARALLVLPTMSLAGAPHPHLGTAVSVAPETLVAEAPIWGANNGAEGFAFLSVTIQGHAATIMIDLNCTKCDLALSPAALGRAGITLANPAATKLDTLTIGKDIQRDVPLKILSNPAWSITGPQQLAPVVGTVGVHFLATHYDILYDFPGRRVQLYALPAHPVAPKNAWLPTGFTPAGCGKMVDIPPGAATFTGVEMQLDGHPVTGALEMGPYLPKMNETAMKTLGLPAQSPRIQPPVVPTDGGHVSKGMVQNVQMTIGTNMFGAWTTEVLEELDVQSLLPPNTPVMLLNLSMLKNVKLFNATSSKQVCVAQP